LSFHFRFIGKRVPIVLADLVLWLAFQSSLGTNVLYRRHCFKSLGVFRVPAGRLYISHLWLTSQRFCAILRIRTPMIHFASKRVILAYSGFRSTAIHHCTSIPGTFSCPDFQPWEQAAVSALKSLISKVEGFKSSI